MRVETGAGPVERSRLLGGGPFVLELRLTPPVGFWVVDAISVDYGPDQVVPCRELDGLRADDARYRGLLVANDGRWLDMPAIGDRTELEFRVPPRPQGTQRTVS